MHDIHDSRTTVPPELHHLCSLEKPVNPKELRKLKLPLVKRREFLELVNDRLQRAESDIVATRRDLNLLEYRCLLFPFLKEVPALHTDEYLRDLARNGIAHVRTVTRALMGWPEYWQALFAPRDTWAEGTNVPLATWITHSNGHIVGEWRGSPSCLIAAPDGPKVETWHLEADVEHAHELIRSTKLTMNILADCGRKQETFASKMRSDLKAVYQPELAFAIFRTYLQELPEGRGVWARVAERLSKAGVANRSDIIDAANKQTTVARTARNVLGVALQRQYESMIAAKSGQREWVEQSLAAIWGCQPATISQVVS